MRPRIRTLKPETWHDEKVGRLTHHARLLFVVLITMADDEGRFRALPSAILGHGYPYDSHSPAQVNRWLNELADVGLVTLYSVDGLTYGAFPKWQTHQRVNRATASILPEPSLNGHGSFTERSVRTQ